MKAYFAVPGDLSTPSGGYGYARRLLRGAKDAGLDLAHVALPAGFPDPGAADQQETRRRLAEMPDTAPILLDALALAGWPGIEDLLERPGPLVLLCHHPLAMETGLSPERAAELERIEREALDRADAVVTTSHATADILRTRFGVPDAKLTVAPPGTDAAPRAPGAGGRGCAIVAVGSITPRKGHRRQVAALAGIQDADWTLRIVGPMPDPAEQAELQALIDRHDLGGRITLTGPLSMTAVQAAYQTADLFVLASEYEGFGMAFTEAMANGLPVLGLECAAVAEATRGAARLVSPEAFPAALEDLIRRPASRVALAERCWRAASDLPRWPDTVQTIAGVLRARTGFSPDWLALRQDADRRARDNDLPALLSDNLRQRSARALQVLDLGAGAGANLRALAPVLPNPQHWVLADNDRNLLNRIAPMPQATIQTRLANIPGDLDALFDPKPDLVTASAFFDLSGPEVTDEIVARTVKAGAAFYTVLTFDGREDWAIVSPDAPGHPLQARIDAAFLKDQRRDKGMGTALGPDATDHLAQAFRAAGYSVTIRTSDWQLSHPADSELIEALAIGHAETARADLGDQADIWLQHARTAHRVLIGHQDLLALPPA